jgi:obg-like ATPase 1
MALLKDNKWVTSGDWNDDEIEILNKHLFLTSKPIVYLINLSKADFLVKFLIIFY